MDFVTIRTLLAYLNRNSQVPEGAIKPDVPMSIFNYTDKDCEKIAFELKSTVEGISADIVRDMSTVRELMDYINNGDESWDVKEKQEQ